jgi:type I restriction enzyme, S subunit
MSPKQLLAYFDRIAEAPGAVPRLRRFILDLAVRGKLVEQDAGDAPADKLLEELEDIQRTTLSEREWKRLERVPQPEPTELAFCFPERWELQRMGQLAEKLGAGSPPLGGKTVYVPQGVPFLRSQNVHNRGVRLDDVAYISRGTHERMSGTHVRPRDLLLNITGASIGRCAVVNDDFGEANVSQHVAIIRLFLPAMRHFLHVVLTSPSYQKRIDDVQVGVSRAGLSMDRLRLFPVPIPPLAEQGRIVGKVQELMTLCDRLEAAQAERERRRERAAHVLFQSLGETHCKNSRAPAPQVLERLIGDKQLRALRSRVFDLAFSGPLSSPDTNDESVVRLLESIPKTVTRSKHDPAGSLQCDVEPPFAIPDHWQWTRFGDLILASDAGWSPQTESFPRRGQNWGVLKVSAVSWDVFRPEENKQLLPGVAPPMSAQIEAGDFLISRANTSELVAKAVIVPNRPERLILSDKIVRLKILDSCNKRYLCLVNNYSKHARSYYARRASGTSLSMKNVSRQVIYDLPVPLPPRDEQDRIVAKIDEIMRTCDGIEGSLLAMRLASSRLLEAVLHRALEGPSHQPLDRQATSR